MLQIAIGSFVGCFAAMVTLAEVVLPNKVIRYLAALLVGLVVTVVMALVVGWVSGHVFSHTGG